MISIFLLFIGAVVVCAQTNPIDRVTDRDIEFGNFIRQLPNRSPETKGSYYLDDNWKMSNIKLLSNGVVKGYPAKLDLKHYELDLQIDGEVKVIKLLTIREFSWIEMTGDSSKYVNTEHLYGAVDGTGRVMEELVENEISLYKYTETYILEANYNAAMNVGQKDNLIKTRETFYIAIDNKLTLIDPKLKKNEALFGELYNQVAEFTKNNKLKLNRQEDLIKIVSFLNES